MIKIFVYIGGRISQTLLKATVTVLENAACNKKYGGKITSNMICAAAPGKDTCQVCVLLSDWTNYDF